MPYENDIRSSRYASNPQVYTDRNTAQVASPAKNDARGRVGDHFTLQQRNQFSHQQPPSYDSNLRALNTERLTALTQFDKKLKKKIGVKGAKGAAGGTLIGGGIFGGIVTVLASHSAVTGGIMAKAGAALVAAHFWPVAVFLACAVVGGVVGMAFKQAKVKRLARQDRLGKDAGQIRALRDALLEKRKQMGSLTPEEAQVVKKCSQILSRFHINPLKALGEMSVGALAALPLAVGIAGAIVALFLSGGDGIGGSSGSGGVGGSGGGGAFGGSGGGGGGLGTTNVMFWDPYLNHPPIYKIPKTC